MRQWRRKRIYPKMHDINVTNLVDVVLVILIVFMISAPLMQSGIEVNLPKTKVADAAVSDGVVVTIDVKGFAYIDDRLVNLDQFETKIKDAYDQASNKKVFLRADASVTHGTVIDIMGRIKAAGISEVALVTKPPEEGGKLRSRKK
jgi:biopolymer transport protein TolR